MSSLDSHDGTKNPLNPKETLGKRSADEVTTTELSHDSATTKSEYVDRNGGDSSTDPQGTVEPPNKRARLDSSGGDVKQERKKGVVPIKPEYLISINHNNTALNGKTDARDENAEQDGAQEKTGKRQKSKGQNTGRNFGSSRDALPLCMSRANTSEFSPTPCHFGDKCKYEHDLRKYLDRGKRADLDTFSKMCPVFAARGRCDAGWRCRWASSHSIEKQQEDGRKELVLLPEESDSQHHDGEDGIEGDVQDTINLVSAKDKIELRKKQKKTPKADKYTKWLDELAKEGSGEAKHTSSSEQGENSHGTDKTVEEGRMEHRAAFKDPPFLPSEKRRLYYGEETPVLAPLTTQGNLPFRRLCVELGAQVTWSEMAMGLPLIQGEKGEWALLKGHKSELQPPVFRPKEVIEKYDNSRDFRFGAQIAANKPWLALKTTEVITALCPQLRAVDLNCGCPIDLVYRQGAGSALLDTPSRLAKILRGMNAVSGEVPITVKIRTGVKDGAPTAEKLVKRLAFGGPDPSEAQLGPAGVAAITLHGRSRQQRYTRSADWSYISECAAIVKNYNRERDASTDTVREVDERNQANGKCGRLYFVGNGDCYSHEDYYQHIEHANVDSVMVARGALIKPWIFEEIALGQHLDKSASERLAYVEKFARYGLQNWGSDEIGVGTTRRFLLEWLSFSCRYVPVGILEHLPPNIQDRPPAYRGRSELETLLSSENYKDWIKISEMFLGPAHKDFKFEPKHKSNSYDNSTEG